MRLYAYVQVCHVEMMALAALPVLLGLALAAQAGPIDAFIATITLLFALTAQAFCNAMNDWVDFRSGNDYAGKPGMPKPLVSGALSEQAVLHFATLLGGVMLLLGAVLVHMCLPWICFPLLLVPAAAWALTGQPLRMDYKGFSEILIFLSLGWINTAGCFWLQRGSLSMQAMAAGTMTGLLCVNVLLANNLRDVHIDEFCRKRTMAVTFGRSFTLMQYATNAVIAACLLGWITEWNWILAVLLFTFLSTRALKSTTDPKRLNELLNNTLLFTIAGLAAVIIYIVSKTVR